MKVQSADNGHSKQTIIETCHHIMRENPEKVYGFNDLAIAIVGKGDSNLIGNVRRRLHELDKKGSLAAFSERAAGTIIVEAAGRKYERRIEGLKFSQTGIPTSQTVAPDTRFDELAHAEKLSAQAGELKEVCKIEDAIKLFEEAKGIYNSLSSRGTQEDAYRSAHAGIALGYAYLANKQSGLALTTFLESIEIYQKSQARFLADYSWGVQGVGCAYLLKKRQLSRAIRWLAEALGVRRAIVHQNERFYTALSVNLNSLGSALQLSHEIDGAIECYAERLTILRQLARTSEFAADIVETRVNLALSFQHRGEEEKSKDQLAEALKLINSTSFHDKAGPYKIHERKLREAIETIGKPSSDLGDSAKPSNFRIFPRGY